MILLYAGAFSVSYLVMPGSVFRSGVGLATLSLVYSALINYFSTSIILRECSRHSIVDYFDYYKHVCGPRLGKAMFFVFFLNSFFICVCTLISMNELLADFMKSFTALGAFTEPVFCFWAVVITLLETPFIYKSTDESMALITLLTSFAILMSLVAVGATFVQNGAFHSKGGWTWFDLSGSVFSFDVSYFSFIVQLNIFDLFEMFEGSPQTRFRKIRSVSLYTNFLIFAPAFLMGTR